MAGDIEVRISGLDELKAQLRALPDKLRRQALRNALAAGGRLVRDAIKARAPVLRSPHRYRKAGTLRDAIRVRTSKQARQAGDVGVFVNVKPLKGRAIAKFKQASGLTGAQNPDDPYYWQWQEFGRKGRAASGAPPKRRGLVGGVLRTLRGRRAQRAVSPLPALGFLRAGAQMLGDALRKIEQVLGPQVQRILDRQAEE
ncbi:HK97-gp10 family putative phage morphogenesis protein [Paucibacter sp. R3-3]|uniref:HK97-gp10 family putative phage morphogenesis protein n=1 Tax=Roseateles agri TaxID=3098619 RepID=A0ABU5DQA3_9BURK|nr:HK97-gp10 family putative phage morphogenesis protein [Paucibacter sp. R3-3]MDY0748506.1 HK97-gp10 family putative phage morphogenesis protein [Paucibacter sp. R3-3]